MNENLKTKIEKTLSFINDKSYISALYFFHFKRVINWKNPQRFSEKIQILKLKDRNSLYTKMVDKYEVKKYISEKIGEQYLIPTIGIWDNFEDINFNDLPDKFVLKCTHDSGGLIICKNKKELNLKEARNKIEKSLNRNFFYHGREWPYKNVIPKIIAEEYLENGQEGLHDYKIWCFNGKPKYIQYITGRIGNKTYEGFYDLQWNLKDFSYHNPIMEKPVKKPECLDKLILLSEMLSNGTKFMRCDFYILDDGSIKFGEITFFPMSGFETWKPDSTDLEFGKMINLE